MTPKRVRSPEEILADVAAVTAEINGAQGSLDGAYARRLDLFHEARALVPPITHKALAEVAGVSEVAIIQARRKAAERAASG